MGSGNDFFSKIGSKFDTGLKNVKGKINEWSSDSEPHKERDEFNIPRVEENHAENAFTDLFNKGKQKANDLKGKVTDFFADEDEKENDGFSKIDKEKFNDIDRKSTEIFGGLFNNAEKDIKQAENKLREESVKAEDNFTSSINSIRDNLNELLSSKDEDVKDSAGAKESLADKSARIRVALNDKFVNLVDVLGEKINDTRDSLSDKISDVADKASDVKDNATDKVSDKVSNGKDTVSDVADDVEKKVSKGSGRFDTTDTFSPRLVSNVKDKIVNKAEYVANKVSDSAGEVRKAVEDKVADLKEEVVEASDEFADGLVVYGRGAKSFVDEKVKSFKDNGRGFLRVSTSSTAVRGVVPLQKSKEDLKKFLAGDNDGAVVVIDGRNGTKQALTSLVKPVMSSGLSFVVLVKGVDDASPSLKDVKKVERGYSV